MYNSMRSRVTDDIQASSIIIEWSRVDHAKRAYAKIGSKKKNTANVNYIQYNQKWLKVWKSQGNL